MLFEGFGTEQTVLMYKSKLLSRAPDLHQHACGQQQTLFHLAFLLLHKAATKIQTSKFSVGSDQVGDGKKAECRQPRQH